MQTGGLVEQMVKKIDSGVYTPEQAQKLIYSFGYTPEAAYQIWNLINANRTKTQTYNTPSGLTPFTDTLNTWGTNSMNADKYTPAY
jgi:hypothetical protein